jgi:shikimate dehydrogenase
MTLTGATRVAGVVGSPVTHSLSPMIHNAWIQAAGIDAVYIPLSPSPERFGAFIASLRGGSISGLNVTVPFKEQALAAADEVTARARAAGAANVLVFQADGTILADNTDGLGLIRALHHQAPGLRIEAKPAVVLGAGGAARGAVAALIDAGCPQVRIVNRTRARAEALAVAVDGPTAVFADAEAAAALSGAGLLVNATTLGLGGGDGPAAPLEVLAPGAVVMDMVYKPLRTALLQRAAARGLTTVDGLEMLIRQAMPSFEAFFGAVPPAGVDVRALALATLEP